MGKSKQIATMLTGAPVALDTLDELAAALGDDANFATTVTNSLATKLDITDPAIDMGTNKKIRFTGNIGEIGSVPGFQATNDANDGLRSMGMRASSLRFATGSSERLRIDENGNIGIGISPATTAGVNYARMVIDADSSNYPKSLEINATNAAGPNFSINSYSDNNGSYYLLGANLQLQSNGNFAWENNGEHMSGISIDSRAGHGVTFVDSYWNGSNAYVPAEIGKVHTSTDGRADIIVDATGLEGDGGTNANAFFQAKAKGNYYAGLDIKSNSGHVGGWIGHWNGGSTSRALLARVGGTGINAGGDVTAIYADYAGRVTHPNRPHFRVRGFPSHFYVSTIQSAEDGRLRNWNSVDINRGSHFTNSTGKFTIPVTGDYAFYCTVMYTNPSTMDFHLTFKLNGATLTASNDHQGGGSGQGHQWNGSTLCYSGYFNANDYVGFSITGGGSTSNTYLYQSSTYNVMGGYLL